MSEYANFMESQHSTHEETIARLTKERDRYRAALELDIRERRLHQPGRDEVESAGSAGGEGAGMSAPAELVETTLRERYDVRAFQAEETDGILKFTVELKVEGRICWLEFSHSAEFLQLEDKEAVSAYVLRVAENTLASITAPRTSG